MYIYVSLLVVCYGCMLVGILLCMYLWILCTNIYCVRDDIVLSRGLWMLRFNLSKFKVIFHIGYINIINTQWFILQRQQTQNVEELLCFSCLWPLWNILLIWFFLLIIWWFSMLNYFYYFLWWTMVLLFLLEVLFSCHFWYQ